MKKFTGRAAFRPTRWMLALTAVALIPVVSGCATILQDGAWFYGIGYAAELLLTPARSLLGTATLGFINSH